MLLIPLLLAAADDVLIRRLVLTSFIALGRLAPRGNRVTAARGTAFAAAQRVIDRVHSHAADMRALAQPARTACFAGALVHVVRVGHGTDRGDAFLTHDAQLARRQLDLGIALITANQLPVGAGSAA